VYQLLLLEIQYNYSYPAETGLTNLDPLYKPLQHRIVYVLLQ